MERMFRLEVVSLVNVISLHDVVVFFRRVRFSNSPCFVLYLLKFVSST